jgi:CopG family nickel-responsive transcriptional regulator
MPASYFLGPELQRREGMERITITIDDDLLASIDGLIKKRGYPSRSEAIRELVRDAATRDHMSQGAAPCVAALSYVYDHTARDLSQRLVNAQHDHHDLSIATTHVHFDHDSCLEVAILRGSSGAIQKLADNLTAQRGVRHASLNIIPLKSSGKPHRHGPTGAPHTH